MSKSKPTYEELEARLNKSKEIIEVLRNGEADAVVSKQDVLLLRLRKAEKALQQALKDWQGTFNATEDLIMVVDTEHRIIQANVASLTFFGRGLDDIVGRTCCELVHGTDAAPAECPLERARRTRQHEDTELYLADKDIWITASLDPIFDDQGNVTRAVHVIRDITGRKGNEEEIRKKNEMLEAFLYMVSHDLKNPVISLQGFCSLLIRNYRKDLNEKALFYVERIRANAELIADMLEDVLALTQIGSLKEEKAEISTQKVIESVWSSLSSFFHIEDVELIVPESLPRVFYSQKRLYQIFDNLLSNALKFKSETRAARVEIGYEDNGDHYKFFVRDNGIGIEQKYHDKIFDVFSKLEESKSEGTGIGLTIVKRIAETNHGKVWVESQVGVGSIFYFTIPKKI